MVIIHMKILKINKSYKNKIILISIMEEENTHILTEGEYNYLISDIKTKENII